MKNEQAHPVKPTASQVPQADHIQGGKGGLTQGAQANHILGIVQRVIAEITGNEIDDITMYADLEEDLGIDMISELPAIVTKLKMELPDVRLPMSSVMECTTIEELVELIEEEREL